VLLGEHTPHRLAVGNVDLLEAEARMRLQPRQAGPLELRVVVVVEVVDTGNFVAARNEPERERTTDKAGCAGHQHFHYAMLPA